MAKTGFRPLAGCGLFPFDHCDQLATVTFPSPCGVWVVSGAECAGKHGHQVSVPLRGVGCFDEKPEQDAEKTVSVPLRGVGCFPGHLESFDVLAVSVPLRGVGRFA